MNLICYNLCPSTSDYAIFVAIQVKAVQHRIGTTRIEPEEQLDRYFVGHDEIPHFNDTEADRLHNGAAHRHHIHVHVLRCGHRAEGQSAGEHQPAHPDGHLQHRWPLLPRPSLSRQHGHAASRERDACHPLQERHRCGDREGGLGEHGRCGQRAARCPARRQGDRVVWRCCHCSLCEPGGACEGGWRSRGKQPLRCLQQGEVPHGRRAVRDVVCEPRASLLQETQGQRWPDGAGRHADDFSPLRGSSPIEVPRVLGRRRLEEFRDCFESCSASL